MAPSWSKRKAESKCIHCGAVYSVPLSADYRRLYLELPLWFRADFRDEVFWALNGEHLDHLDRVIRATLREPGFGPGQREIPRGRHDESKYALQSPRMVAFRKEPPGFASADRKTSENGAAVSNWLSIIVRTIGCSNKTAAEYQI
jgi:hypothetical protein